MNMVTLEDLVNKVPDWLQRLDNLSGQIDRCQAELAAVAAAEGESPDTKSLRNKGSTKSLKPKVDPPVAHAEALVNEDNIENAHAEDADQPSRTADAPKSYRLSLSPIGTQQEITKADEVKDQVGRKSKSSSVMLDEDTPAAYGARNMIILYYDSYVQGFFYELAKFVSSTRHLLHKSPMAVRPAQIKKRAEQEVPEEDIWKSASLEAAKPPPTEDLPTLCFQMSWTSTRI
ncbi:hypothetical protein FSARC_600 [Fusarium sarcochroum]|uniref:Uncharacterized protein n=1 Tax=Fusarium sarcochroum TaxID=1208366 RepID=A0A8H4XFB5_9HYPO|nr:hypothetical protein FSARC_600 [Fusarium sarcochroum]